MRYLKFLYALIPIITLLSCSDIEGLNDYNAVFSFEISESKGADGTIDLGQTRVTANEVYIPVLHGIHSFPLYFKGEPKFENPIDRVAGIDFGEWIKIDLQRGGENGDEPLVDDSGNYLFEEPEFYVQALSGLPRRYTFKIEYTSTSSDADIFPAVSFKESPSGTVIGDLLTIAQDEGASGTGKASITVVDPAFPFSVVPEFTLSDGASIQGNGEAAYGFANLDDTHTVTVVARDGTRKQWTLGLALLPVVNADSEGYDAATLASTALQGFSVEPASRGFSIEEYTFSASTQNGEASVKAGRTPNKPENNTEAYMPELSEHPAPPSMASMSGERMTAKGTAGRMKIHAGQHLPADTLKLHVNTSFTADPFPVTIDMELPNVPGVALYGNASRLVFDGMDNTNDFWLLDTGNGLARHWVVALEEYASPIGTVVAFSYDYTASEVRENSLSDPKVPAIVMDEAKTVDIDPVNRCIYLRAVEIHKPKYSSLDPWKLNMTVCIQVSGGAALVDLGSFDWTGEDSWMNPKTFGIKAADGSVKEWKIVIRDWSNGAPEASDDCELYDVSVVEVRPYRVELEPEALTIDHDAHTVTLNLRRDDDAYPLSLAVGYRLSDFARISTQNGGRDPMVFSSPQSVNNVTVVSESGNRTQQWTFRLRPPLKETGTDVTSFKISSFSDSGFGAELTGIDNDNAVISVNFTRTGTFPVVMNIRMGLSYKAASSVTDAYGSGSFTFDKVEDKTFTVTAQNGQTRQWTLRATYMPQLQNAGFESWADLKTPLPKGVKGSPYWASANMTSPVAVEGTTQTSGAPGQGKAVQLKTTNTIIGRLASGSLFLGWFDDSNPMGNMNDPTVMTFQGIPFSTNKRIKGFSADVCYHPGGGDASDAGSLAIELIRQRDSSAELEYHGQRPGGEGHPNNNADMVARGHAVVAVKSGMLDNGDTATHVVPDGEWQTIFVPLAYEGDYPSYTHLSIICSSSSQGDAFKGSVGSTLKIDNIKLVYEE